MVQNDEEAAPKGTKKRKAGGAMMAGAEKRQKGKPRPQSGWMVFLAEYRPIFVAENPGLPVTAVTKAAGALWKPKTAEEKEVKDPLL